MPTVTVLVGPIASGKSTYSRRAARRGEIVISDDAIVTALHGGDYNLYERTLKPLYKAVENAALAAAVALGRDVVVDRGVNNSVGSRRRWVGLAKSLDCRVVAVEFPDDGAEVHARRRTESDARGHDCDYWLRVARHHADRHERPTAGEGFDGVYLAYRDRDGEWQVVENVFEEASP